jgi:hypothetical protein
LNAVVKKRPNALSTVVSFMSDANRNRLEAGSELDRLSLEDIRPDPDQPRRLLSTGLSDMLAEGATPVEVMRVWRDSTQAKDAPSWFINQFNELRTLADSIAHNGLINPISVRPTPTEIPIECEYLIVTGERRYWAHVLLWLENRRIHEGHSVLNPDEIKATIVPEGVRIRAHQLIENIVREDINAVERAAGLWALREEISGVNHGSPYDEKALVPWHEVEDFLNISKRYRIYLTSVLSLPDKAKDMVQAFNMSERTLRPIITKLRDRPDLQLQAVSQLAVWYEKDPEERGPREVEQLIGRLLTSSGDKMVRPATVKVQAQTRTFHRLLKRLDRAEAGRWFRASPEAANDLRALRDEIDRLLATAK